MKYVARMYKDGGWTIKWMKEFIDLPFLNRVIDRDKIIICCDNLFGSFGCHMFSENMLERFHFLMRMILNHENNFKVLLGIHEHVIEEMPSKYSLLSQDYTVFVDLDSLSQSEALLICMMQQNKSKIEQENIPFDDFLELIENRSAIVGTPFQTMMISASPVVFGTKEFCNLPLKLLIEHFTKLYYSDKEMFYSLLYITCVMIFDRKSDEIEKDIANAIYPVLDKNTIILNLPSLAPYIKYDGDTVETNHDMISIALFHTFMKESKTPWSLFSACDIRGLLELIRPDNQRDKLHQFAIPLLKETLNKVKTVLKCKIVKDKVDITDHPLLEFIS